MKNIDIDICLQALVEAIRDLNDTLAVIAAAPRPVEAAPQPDVTPVAMPATAADAPTIEQVRAAIAPLGKDRALAILAQFKAQRLGDIDPADYAAVIEAAG